MPEVPVAALDSRQQKLIENARVALERGQLEYVSVVTEHVLESAPACLPVRRLQRVAHLRERPGGAGAACARLAADLAALRHTLGKTEPKAALAAAETLLAKAPTSLGALRLLARAAKALDLPETAAFALDAIRELRPDDRANLLALAEAWLEAGRPAEALKIVDALLREKPSDAAAQALLRRASVAQTVGKHAWDQKTGYREKLRDAGEAVSLEHASRLVTSETMAQRLLDEALSRVAREPLNLNHYRSVTQAYRQLGNLHEALAWVRKARQQPTGRSDAALEKEETELSAALIEQRVRAAEAAAQAAPQDAKTAGVLTAARRELADFKLAESRRYAERYPNDYAGRHTLGVLLLEAGAIDEAIAQFQQAQKGPAVRIDALVALGRCFKAKHLFDLAVGQFTTAQRELGPMDDAKKEVTYELADCYERLGRGEDAMAEYKSIYREDIGYRDVAAKVNAFYARG